MSTIHNNDPNTITGELNVLSDDHAAIGVEMRKFIAHLHTIGTTWNDAGLDTTKKYMQFVERCILPHFHEEETLLFKLIMSLPKEIIHKDLVDPLVQQLIDEHDLLRNLFARMGTLLEKSTQIETSLHMFIANAKSFVSILQAHAEKESAMIYFLSAELENTEHKSKIEELYNKLHEKQ